MYVNFEKTLDKTVVLLPKVGNGVALQGVATQSDWDGSRVITIRHPDHGMTALFYEDALAAAFQVTRLDFEDDPPHC